MNSVDLFFEDDKQAIIELARRRKILRDSSNPLELDDFTFITYFRLSKVAFMYVLEDVEPHLKNQIRLSSIPNILKLASVLRFFVKGSYQRGTSNDFLIGMAQPTFSLVLTEILNALETILCSKWIIFKMSEDEKRSCKKFFYNKRKIPGVIGCVDGTHVKIIKPKEEVQHLYYNRKGFFSINVLIVCDHQMKIRYINGKHPGSSHDAMVWDLSKLKNQLMLASNNGEKNLWLLGDAGYKLQPVLMTPFRAPESGSPQSRYNEYNSVGRHIVERTFGVWKNRFRCVLGARQLHYKPEKVTQIINVCAALHNICIHYRVQEPSKYNEPAADIHLVELDEDTGEDIGYNEATIIRNKIVNSLL